MVAQMVARVEQFQIADAAIPPVMIFVMDVKTFWNRAVMVHPNAAVQKPLTVNPFPGLKVATACLKPIFRASIKSVLALRHKKALHRP